jgi:hypothetical protein
MANAEDEKKETGVLDLADEPIVSDAISPEFFEERALQRFTDGTGIVKFCDAIGEKSQHAFAVLWVEPGEFAAGRCG